MEHITTATLRAHIGVPTNDEARITATTALGPKDQQTHSDCASGDAADKGKANIAAELALRGYCLHSLSNGTWIVSKWNPCKPIANLQEATAFLQQVGGAR